MKAKLLIGGQVRKINEREVNGYVRTVKEAFRMESCVNADVKVEVVE